MLSAGRPDETSVQPPNRLAAADSLSEFTLSESVMVLAQPLPIADSDLERIQRARLGDPDALQELIISHRTIVEQVARSFVSDHADIDDIAQETWIRASQALGSLREGTRFRPWLRAITRNACLTFLSRRRHCDSLDVEDAPDPADPAADGPEASAEQRDERRRVWEALGALPELDRRALYLREVESLPFEEVARSLGIRRNAAEVRVHRARTRFRQLYEATDVTQPACGMAGIRLALLLDGELHGETADAVELHLNVCSACTERVRTMAQGRSLYQRMGMFALPGLSGLLERWQRPTDALMRWMPADSASLLAGSSAGPAAASGIVAAVVAVAIFSGPFLSNEYAADSEVAHMAIPAVVAAMIPAPPDHTAAVLEPPQVATPLVSLSAAVADAPLTMVSATPPVPAAEEPAQGLATDSRLPAVQAAEVQPPPMDREAPTSQATTYGASTSPETRSPERSDRDHRAAEDEKGRGKASPARATDGKNPSAASLDHSSPRASVGGVYTDVTQSSPRSDAADVQRSSDRPHEAGRAVEDHAEERASAGHSQGKGNN